MAGLGDEEALPGVHLVLSCFPELLSLVLLSVCGILVSPGPGSTRSPFTEAVQSLDPGPTREIPPFVLYSAFLILRSMGSLGSKSSNIYMLSLSH